MPMSFTSGTGQTGLSFTKIGNPTAGAGVGEAGGQESSSGLLHMFCLLQMYVEEEADYDSRVQRDTDSKQRFGSPDSKHRFGSPDTKKNNQRRSSRE